MPLTSEQKRRKSAEREFKGMPLKTLQDYEKYNAARKEKGLPVVPAPVEMHQHVKVKFLRRDGMTHRIRLKFRNHQIDFDKWVEHGKIYELPVIVVKQYQNLGIPKYVKYTDPVTKESETRFSHKDPRFAFQIIFDE